MRLHTELRRRLTGRQVEGREPGPSARIQVEDAAADRSSHSPQLHRCGQQAAAGSAKLRMTNNGTPRAPKAIAEATPVRLLLILDTSRPDGGRNMRRDEMNAAGRMARASSPQNQNALASCAPADRYPHAPTVHDVVAGPRARLGSLARAMIWPRPCDHDPHALTGDASPETSADSAITTSMEWATNQRHARWRRSGQSAAR
jgi:hypothetical protein